MSSDPGRGDSSGLTADGGKPMAPDDSVAEGSVLCVDLDGTLIRTDTLYEYALIAIKSRPDVLVRLPLWLAGGRYHVKRRITEFASRRTEPPVFPIEPAVTELVAAYRTRGKPVELVTAADQRLVERHPELGSMFDAVIGSADGTNLKGEAKAEMLRRRHPGGFAYVGNSADDLPVWRLATKRYGVNLRGSVRRAAGSENLGLVELSSASPVLPALLRSMRPHQWLKNLLVLVPLLLIATSASLALAGDFVLAFVLISLLTSGTYLVNDLFDLDADRRHARKRFRPIASGDLPVPVAVAASIVMVVGALAGSAALLGPAFFLVAAVYLALTLAYSFRLKQVPIVDVMAVAALFMLRVLGGMVLLHQPPSPWLLMFSVFFFLSLALMKREVELNAMAETGANAVAGRGYGPDDRGFIVAFGISCGVASLVVFSLFISAMTNLAGSNYAAPAVFWFGMPVIAYWLARMWLLTARGQMNDDPILYAARDPVSLVLGGATVLVAIAAEALPL